jgi:LmbE family N-acetylglucosaminyl deacetylase
MSIFTDDASRRRVTEILRQLAPQLVITASPVDYLCDHEATSQLVRDACFAAMIPNYATGAVDAARQLRAIPHLYFMDPIGGVDREGHPVLADIFVNVAAQMDTKTAMLAEHASQREWLLRHHGLDNYLETMRAWTRENGRRAGLEYAEGFRRYKGHPYPESPLLEELLGATVLHRT